MKVNHDTIYKTGIRISTRVGFGFHDNDFLFPSLVSHPNALMNEKWNEMNSPFPIPYSNVPNVPFGSIWYGE